MKLSASGIKNFLLKEIQNWTRMLLMTAVICSALLYIPDEYLLLDLISHFRLQYLLIGVLGIFVFSLSRQPRLILIGGICFFMNFPEIFPYISFNLQTSQATASEELKIFLGNIHTENRNFGGFIKTVSRINPDIILALEIDKLWASQLAPLFKDFPYQKISTREDNFGIALLSKINFTLEEDKRLMPFDVPAIKAQLEPFEIPIQLIGIHAIPPVTLRQFHLRNKVIERAGILASESKTPTIVMGDFNATMWSPVFKSLLENSPLINPREGLGIFPTWPRLAGFSLIPIDHILFTKEFRILSYETVDIPGSDHIGVFVRLSKNPTKA